MHISVHIERTGGTSLVAEFEEIYGAEKILIYSTLTKKLVRLSDIPVSPASESLSKVKAFIERTAILSFFYRIYLSVVDNINGVVPWIELDEIPDDAAVIKGHFRPDLFAELIPSSFTSVVLREPLTRMISQYRHWKRAGGDMGFRVEIPYDPEMTFEEYAFREELANFQTRALGMMKVDEFDLVGITSNLDKFVARLKGLPLQENFEATQVNYIGHEADYEELGITPQIIEKFKEFNAEDYENYQKAVEMGG
ncbi:MAG: hypothetical protein MAG431_01118 [Chloroflexi bacterium]|nr:hypothetical protein [Chloroflexota bacterium]